jgi:hypothetical protein
MASGAKDWVARTDIYLQTLAEIMVRGAADWVNKIDVYTQTLSEIISRNKYGAIEIFNETYTSTSPGSSLRLSVSGKGIIYGGFIYSYNDAAAVNSGLWFNIDGEVTSSTILKYGDLLTRNIIRPGMLEVYLTLYDTTNNIFCAGIVPGITFESSLYVYISHSIAGVKSNLNFWYATL